MTLTDLADYLYDRYHDGPQWRRDYGDKPAFRYTLDRIRGDSDGAAEIHRERWMRMARAVDRLLHWVALGNGVTLPPDEWEPK